MLDKCRLTISEAQTIIDAHKTWVLKEMWAICGILREKGIKRYTISRNVYEALYLALSPHVYMNKDVTEKELQENITTRGIIFIPDDKPAPRSPSEIYHGTDSLGGV